jgi:hypothetical protein
VAGIDTDDPMSVLPIIYGYDEYKASTGLKWNEIETINTG